MLDTALDFLKDICDHIDVLLSMFIVKKYFLCVLFQPLKRRPGTFLGGQSSRRSLF